MNGKKLLVPVLSIVLGLAIVGMLLRALADPPPAYADPINLFVTTSGSGSACTQAAPCSLPTALVQATDDDTIYLAGGIYTGSGTAVVTATNSITVFGGWDGTTVWPPVRDPAAHPTTLDGQGQRRVVFIGSFITPTLDGLIITGGDATTVPDPGRGGGIYSLDARPMIQNNLIISNVATADGLGFGGGVSLGNGSGARLENNWILSNTASITGGLGFGGGVALLGAHGVMVAGNRVTGNVAQAGTAATYGSEGGGIYCTYSDNAEIRNNFVAYNIASALASGGGGGIGIQGCDRLTVAGNTLQGNFGATPPSGLFGRGGGLWVYTSQDVVIDGNYVLSNTAHWGGGLYLLRNTSFTATNNIISGNYARYKGGGIAFETGVDEPVTGTLAHNTLVANDRGEDEGRIAVHLTDPYVTLVLTNNLIYSHTYGVYGVPDSTATLYKTLFFAHSAEDTGGSGTITNIDPVVGQDPLLDGNHHLQPGSPAIDAGISLLWLSSDIDGEARPNQAGYDIGADEYSISLPDHFCYLPLIQR